MNKYLIYFFLITSIFISPVFLYAENNRSDLPYSGKPNHRKNLLKTIIVDNYYPYTFVNKAGQPDGFSVDLIRAVVKAMNLRADIKVDQWDTAKKNLAAGKIDFLPMMAYSKSRDQHFDFSTPHTIAFDAFFSKKDLNKIKTLDDLHGKKIVVMKQDQAHEYLKQIEFVSPDQIIFARSIPHALLKVSIGEGDVALIPKLVGLIQIKQMDLNNLEMSPIVIQDYKRPFCFSVKKGNQEVLERLTYGLVIIKENGQYDAIYKKWFGVHDPLGVLWKKIIKYIIGGLGAVVVLCCILVLWSVSLKKQVAQKTTQLKRLNKHLIQSSEDRRKAISADLHDSVVQTLALTISKLKNLKESDSYIDPGDIEDIEDRLEQAVNEIRGLIYQIRPPVLDDFEIDMALEFLIDGYNEKQECQIEFINSKKEPLKTSQAIRLILYRAVNELIVNILKHAKTRTAEIALSNTDKDVLIRVEDNGIGFEVNRTRQFKLDAFGLYSLSEQIESVGGKFKIVSKPGKGTKISILTPLVSGRDT